MPYPSVEAAREAKFPTKIDGVALTLEQINALAESYDAIKAKGEAEEPMGVAIAQFKDAHEVRDGAWVAKKNMSAEADTQPKIVFGPGHWNHDNYTEADCLEMVANFEQLKERFLPPITLGHDLRQRMAKLLGLPENADGLPNLGEAFRIWWDARRKKVMAQFRNLPDKLKALVREGRFPRVSVVLIHGIDDDGVKRKNVIAEVALQGSDMSGFMDQTDTLVLMSAQPAWMRGATWTRFEVATDGECQDEPGGDNGGETVEKNEGKGAETMLAEVYALFGVQTQDEVVSAFGALKSEIEALRSERDRYKTERDEFETRVGELTQKVNDADEKEREVKVNSVLAQAMREGRVAPLAVERESEFALSLDTSRRVKFSAGGEVEQSAFDRYLDNILARPQVVRFSEEAAGDEHAVDKSAEKPEPGADLPEAARTVLKRMGVSLDDYEAYKQTESKDE